MSAYEPSGPRGRRFCTMKTPMKRLRVFLLLLGWDASPSQGHPLHEICRYPSIHLGGGRLCESKVSNALLPGNNERCVTFWD